MAHEQRRLSGTVNPSWQLRAEESPLPLGLLERSGRLLCLIPKTGRKQVV